MKKFLSILLILSASFASAFAAAGTETLTLNSETKKVLNSAADFSNVTLSLGNFALNDSSARTIGLGSINGTKIGATNDKLAFYGGTPRTRPSGSLLTAIANLNLVNAPTVSFSELAGKPTTLAGYGITDAATATHTHAFSTLTSKPTTLTGYGITDAATATHTHAFSTLTSKPTTLAGYGITDAAASSHTHAFSSLTSKPTTLTGYGITDGQPLDSDLTSIAGVATTSFGRNLLALADGPALLSAAGAAASSHAHTFSSLTSKPTTLSGFGITDGQPFDSDLTALAAVSGQTTFGRNLLTLANAPALLALSGAQPLDSDLTSIAGLTTASYGRSLLELGSSSALRTSAGVVIGADVQAFDSDLSSIAAVATTGYGRGTLALADPAALRTYGGLVIGTNVQAQDGDLDAIAALTTQTYGRSLLTQASASALRTTAGLVIGTDVQAFDGDLAAIASHVTTNYGRGLLDVTDAANLRSTAGLVIGTDVQAFDADLAGIASHVTTSYGRGLLDMADAATLRSYAGLGTIATQNAASVTIGTLDAGTITENSWSAATLQNSWSNLGGSNADAGYYTSRSGRVFLRGMITGGTVTSGTVLFTLPAGSRPPTSEYFPITSNNTFGSIQINTAGNVIVYVGSNNWLSLSGVSFRTN